MTSPRAYSSNRSHKMSHGLAAARLSAVIGLFLVIASCGSLKDAETTADNSRAVLQTAFKNIDRRYATDPSLDELSFRGLEAVIDQVPLASVHRTKSAISLIYDDRTIGTWSVKPIHDHTGWATTVADALKALSEESTLVQNNGHDATLETFFDGGLTKLDKYTRYATPAQAVNHRARRDGFGGLGISLKYEDGLAVISAVHPDTPAERADLRPGDRVTHVGETALKGLTQSDVVARLRGPPHSEVALTIARPDYELPLTIQIVRAYIILPTVKAKLDDGFLYVKVSGFNQGTSRALGRELASVERTEATALRGIILDLRANPGGLLDQAVAISDFFLNDGRVISTRGRHQRANQVFDASWGERFKNLPMALLVNGRSASASEIVAAALRDRGRAVVVGTSSFGKGSVQTIIRLPNSGELTMTWAHLIAPSGFNLQGHGVIPAICTSVDSQKMGAMIMAMQAPYDGSQSIFRDMLNYRHALRKDPDRARQDCPPSDLRRAEDIEIAKYVLTNRALYARALVDGGPAIAETTEETAK